MGIIDSFKRGFSGDDSSRYSIAGIAVRCSHCDGEKFEIREALLNTAGMTFVRLDWANSPATVLVCANCSHLTWFLEEPEQI